MILERHRYKKSKNDWVIFETQNLEYEPYEYSPENIRLLSQMIRDKLNVKYLSSIYKEANKTNPLFGHCYHSTQALYFFFNCDILNSLLVAKIPLGILTGGCKMTRQSLM